MNLEAYALPEKSAPTLRHSGRAGVSVLPKAVTFAVWGELFGGDGAAEGLKL